MTLLIDGNPSVFLFFLLRSKTPMNLLTVIVLGDQWDEKWKCLSIHTPPVFPQCTVLLARSPFAMLLLALTQVTQCHLYECHRPLAQVQVIDTHPSSIPDCFQGSWSVLYLVTDLNSCALTLKSSIMYSKEDQTVSKVALDVFSKNS